MFLMGNLMTELQGVACHMGSHSVTCHQTQANTPALTPASEGWYSIYLSRRDGRLSWPRWLDSARAGSQTRDRCDRKSNALPSNRCPTKTSISWSWSWVR